MSVELAIQRLREQQSKVKERSPQWMVARQLMDLVRAEPQCGEIIAQDLEVEAMSITGRAEAAADIPAGVARAVELGGNGPVCALGTLYFSGDVRQAFAQLTAE